MAKTKISEWSTTPASNTDIDGINIAEGCAPSGINDAIRDLMAQVRSWQSGASGDPFNGPMNGTIGATTAYSGAFTTLSASGTTTLSGLTASTALALDASKNVVSVANTGSGSNVLATSPTLVTPALGTPSSATLTNATGLPISTGVSGLGTGVATALAVNVGSAGAPIVNGGALGTPSSGTVTNLTGTASININGTVGATTPTTGAFTTLAASSSVTLSGGTANGVTYLNGSKVLTSGSALTFDGTTLTGTASGALAANFNRTTSSGATVKVQVVGNDVGTLGSDTGGNGIFDIVAATSLHLRTGTDGTFPRYIGFSANGTEGMRLTSTGLGIGTSSPAYKLQVNVGGTGTGFQTYNGSNYVSIGGHGSGTSYIKGYEGTVAIGNIYAGSLTFLTGDAEKMRLDSAGNLGLGVTPSAWVSGYKVIQNGNSSWYTNTTGQFQFAANTYQGTGFVDRYITSAFATKYQQQNGIHSWLTAASGTAGDAISFTQAMTLDASGNLIVGGTSALVSTSGRGNITINGTSDSILAFGIGGTNSGYIYSTASALTINAQPSRTLNFETGGSERARIDSSGNLLVGTTSAFNSARVSVNAAGSSGSIALSIGNANDTYYAANFRNAAGTSVGNISCTVSATAYNTSSDYRLKNSVAPMTGALAKVAQLKPVTYKWNADGSDGEGFIAHELAEVCPHAVTGEKDAVDEDGNPKYQGIDTSFLVATLTAALQELNAKFDAYVASHP